MKKTLAWILLTTLAFTLFMLPSNQVAADETTEETEEATSSESTYTRKVVSVVFDNSGSMADTYAYDNRVHYARYALEILAGLLNAEDVLYITPMNEATVYEDGSVSVTPVKSNKSSVQMDLTADRDAEIQRILNMNFSKILKGYTPTYAVDVAIDLLESEGMKTTTQSLLDTNETPSEYWLIILSDGEFRNPGEASKDSTLLNNYVNKYANFKLVYLAMGSESDAMVSEKLDSSIDAVTCPDTSKLAETMQRIANDLSGRCVFSEDVYSLMGRTLIIDLDNFGSAVRNIALIMQECGATIESVTYNGDEIEMARFSQIRADSELGMMGGCCCAVNGDPLFKGGKLKIVLSEEISPSQLSILAEPALYAEIVLEKVTNGFREKLDAQTINATLGENDELSASVIVYEEGTEKSIDINELFDDVSILINYNGKEYSSGDSIKLVEGSNEIRAVVSVMDGEYILRANRSCVIEKDPTYFRVESNVEKDVEGDGNLNNTQTVFTVFSNNKPISKRVLEASKWTVTLTRPDGKVAYPETIVNDDGTVSVPVDLTDEDFGMYTLTMQITMLSGMSRKGETTLQAFPNSVTLIPVEDSFQLTRKQFENNTSPIEFYLFANDIPFSFEDSMVTYKVTLGQKDITDLCNISGEVLRFMPTPETVSQFADKDGEATLKVTVKVECNGRSVDDKVEVPFSVVPSVYAIEKEEDQTEVDRFNINESNARVRFYPTIDGKRLTKAEVEEALQTGELTVDTSSFFAISPLECKYEVLDNGAIEVRCEEIHLFYLSRIAEIFVAEGEKEVKLTFNNAMVASSFNVFTGNYFSFAAGICHIVFIIIFLLFVAYYIYVWVTRKFCERFPKGYIYICIYDVNNGEVDMRQVKELESNAPLINRLKPFIEWVMMLKGEDLSTIRTQRADITLQGVHYSYTIFAKNGNVQIDLSERNSIDKIYKVNDSFLSVILSKTLNPDYNKMEACGSGRAIMYGIQGEKMKWKTEKTRINIQQGYISLPRFGKQLVYFEEDNTMISVFFVPEIK